MYVLCLHSACQLARLLRHFRCIIDVPASIWGPHACERTRHAFATAHPNECALPCAGTEDGAIHKCSTSYSEQYLESYAGHIGPVYALQWSPFAPAMFLSCSGDWTVRAALCQLLALCLRCTRVLLLCRRCQESPSGHALHQQRCMLSCTCSRACRVRAVRAVRPAGLRCGSGRRAGRRRCWHSRAAARRCWTSRGAPAQARCLAPPRPAAGWSCGTLVSARCGRSRRTWRQRQR